MISSSGSVHVVVGAEASEFVSKLTDTFDGTAVSVETVADSTAVRERLADGDVRSVLVSDSEDRDGLALFREIRATETTVPVVLFAANADPERVETALAAGVTDYFDVGMDAEQLEARLEAYATRWPTDGFVATQQWDDIAGSLAHDAKNPLNVVMGRLELLDIEEPHEEPLLRSVDRVESLLSELSRIGTCNVPVTETEPVALDAVATEAWTAADRGESTLAVTSDRTVEGDPDRLLVLFERLFENAIEHSDEPVTVSVGDSDSGFYVADDGPGFDAEAIDEVFEQGYGTATNGEGYGLFVVQVVARAHGWSVTAGVSAAGGARIDVHTV